MRKYIDIIREAEADFGTTALLYHGTNLDNALGVIADGGFSTDYSTGDNGPKGISLTRSYRIAADHGRLNSEALQHSMLFGIEGFDDMSAYGIFVFNRAGIADQLVHYDDGFGEEHEERYVGDLPLDHMVEFHARDLDRFVEAVKRAAQQPDGEHYLEDNFQNALQWMIDNAKPLV